MGQFVALNADYEEVQIGVLFFVEKMTKLGRGQWTRT